MFSPLINCNFVLRVEGKYELPCKSVKSISQEAEYEYIQEGGVNDRVHIRRKPLSKPYSFQVERYVGTPYEDIFTLDRVFEMPMELVVSRYQDFSQNPSRTYTFEGCRVISKDYGEFEGGQSGFLTERVTIAYDAMKYKANAKDVKEPPRSFKAAPSGQGAQALPSARTGGTPAGAVNDRKWPETSGAADYWNA